MAYRSLALIAFLCTVFGCGTETMIDHEIEEMFLIEDPNKTSTNPSYRTRSNGEEYPTIRPLPSSRPNVIQAHESDEAIQEIHHHEGMSDADLRRQWLRDHQMPNRALNSFIRAMEPENNERCQNSRHALRGNGIPQITHRTLESFDSVRVSGPILVFARHSDTPRVLIRADGNVVSRIQAETVDGRATIRLNPANVCLGIQPIILLEGPGFGDIQVERSASLEIYELSKRYVRVSVEQTSHLEMHGQVMHLTANAGSFANVIASALTATHVAVSLANNAYASVQASKSVSGHIGRSSQLNIAGSSADIQTTGEGEVTIESDTMGIGTSNH